MADLHLELELARTTVVRGESIPFRITFANGRDRPVTVASGDPSMGAFAIEVRTRATGERRRATALAASEREGEFVHAPPTPLQANVAAGETLVVEGDAIAWAGELEPGEHELVATYSASLVRRLRSTPVVVTVLPDSPVTLRAAAQPSPVLARRNVAWTHRAPEGHVVLLARESVAAPDAVTSCERVATLPAAPELAVASDEPGTSGPVVWLGAEGLHLAQDSETAESERGRVVPLPGALAGASDLEVVAAHVRPAGLELVLARAGVLSGVVALEGREARFLPFDGPKLRRPWAALWLRGRTLVVAATTPTGAVHVASGDPREGPLAGSEVLAPRAPVRGLALASDSRWTSWRLHALAHDRDADTLLATSATASGLEDAPAVEAPAGFATARVLEPVLREGALLGWLVATPDGRAALLRADGALEPLELDGSPVLERARPELVPAPARAWRRGVVLRALGEDRIVRRWIR